MRAFTKNHLRAKCLSIKNITTLIHGHTRLLDGIYQDAIEANYSHEQMTPLNSILGNSKLIRTRFIELHQLLQQHADFIDPIKFN